MPDSQKNDASVVLVVDDNRLNLRIATRFLESIGGFRPVAIREPAEVVGLACELEPEAILMDIMMPKLDGYEVCRRLKRIPALVDVPVVFVTGKNDEESIGKAFEAGGVDYVVKPLDRRALGTRLRVHIDHYRARRELQRSEARLRAAQTTARLGDWEADVEADVFLGSSWTFELCRMAGTRTPEGDEVRAPLHGLLDQLVPGHRERLQHVLRCQPGQAEREARCRSLVDGKARELFFVAHAEGSATGTRVVGTVQDVTERYSALESLRRAEQRLMESKRIEAVGRLAGGVAHEFNNLLQAIMGYSSMLSRRLGETSPEQALVRPILTAGERARELVSQVLLVGHQGPFAPRPVGLCSFVKRFVPTVETVLEAREPISVECVSELTVRADPGLLEHVLMNLCHNALQATTEGGSVAVQVETAVLSEPLRAAGSVIPPGRYVRLAVSDTGTGIPAEMLERVFDPFFTTRPVGKGTGLGLAAVRGIVRQHQGHLLITSSPGVGTTVSVYLAPLPNSSAGEDTQAPASPLPARALVLSRDELTRGILALHVGELGCEVWAVASAAEARPLLHDRVQPIGVLVANLADLPASERPWIVDVAERVPVVVVYEDEAPEDVSVPAGALPLPLPITTDSLRRGLIEAAAK